MNTLHKIKIVGASVLAASFLMSNVAFAISVPNKVKTRLQDLKLKACQAKENVIKNRSTSLTRLVDEMIGKFGNVAKKVEDYYTNTVVSSGKTVSNYDALVADIEAKKSVVQTAIQKTKDDFKQFSCTGDDPKGNMTKFREDMQAVKKALQDYRTSVKNLIHAIRSVVGEETTTQQNSNTNTQENNTQENNTEVNNQ